MHMLVYTKICLFAHYLVLYQGVKGENYGSYDR